MKLSSELILNHLKKNFSFTTTIQPEFNLIYERPTFWTSALDVSDNQIYLCLPEESPNLPLPEENYLLFLIDTGTFDFSSTSASVVLFESDTSMISVSNSLNELFSHYDSWAFHLSQLQNMHGSIVNLMDCSRDIFENPILLHNRDFEWIAYSTMIDHNPRLSYLVSSDNNQSAYRSFRFDRAFQQTFLDTTACFFPDTLTGTKSAYINIFTHGSFIGRIVIPQVCRELQGSDLALLQYLCGYVTATMMDNSSSGRSQKLFTLNNLILQILSDDIKEDSYIEKAMSTFHWESEHSYFCSVFSMDPLDVQNNTFKVIANRLEKLIPESCIIEYKQELVMFVNLSKNNLLQEDVIRMYTPFTRDSYLKTGCSKVYRGFHFSFRLLYEQAQVALSLGNRYFPEMWMHHFNDIADKYLLEKLVNEFPAEMVATPKIVDIYHYDQDHNTQYLNTIKVYLEHNMQPVNTAKSLFIHRTTLMYRLDKIEELFHLSYNRAYDRVFIQLSIMLLELSYLNGIQP